MYSVLSKTKITIAQTQLQEYLHYCEFVRRLAPRTIKTYRKDIAKFIADTGVKDFSRLTNKDLNAWQATLAAEGKTGKTINNYRDAVIGCLRHLVRQGVRVSVDFDLVVRVDEEQRESAYFTEEQVNEIKAACAGLRELLLISLLFDTGMRISEVTALMVEHIHGTRIKVVQGKGRKDRWVFMRQETKSLLERWLNINDISAGYVFPSPKKFGDPLTHQQIRISINAAIRRAGFDEGSAHTFRHSNITHEINQGMDIFTVQTLAGHSDPKVTRRYFHTNADQLQAKFVQAFGA